MKTEQAGRGAVVADPELTAMHRITKQLNALADEQRLRVVSYLLSRYLPGVKFTVTQNGKAEG